MRKVTKDFGTIPAELLTTKCANLIKLSLTQLGSHEFDTNVYGHDDVRLALDQIYKSKCAFCETDPSAGVTMQVEHYRPKAKVTGANTHPGYYWVAYKWSNLLLACPACNNKKRNRFPVNAARLPTHPFDASGNLDDARCLVTSAEFTNEQPQLINPETDPNPMQHFRFQATGLIEHKTEAGRITIETCSLNRGRLLLKRKKVYDTFLNKMIKYFDKNTNGQLSNTKLKTALKLVIEDLIDYILDENNEYTEFAKTCWNEFEGFYIARFQATQRQTLQVAYQEIRDIFDNS